MTKPIFALVLLVSLITPLYAQKKAITLAEATGSQTGDALPFSPGIMVDGTLYVAGQIGGDLKTRSVPPQFEDEMKLALDNVGKVLKAGGMSFDDVVSVQVYLTDMDLFPRMNAVYATYFKEPRPARTTVGVSKLAAPTAHIEITVTAHK